MSQQLSSSARPRSFDALIGKQQQKVVASIRGIVAKGVKINGWMFSGPKGTGKTTIARILALSLNCSHQEKFGAPCNECRKSTSQFPIHEVNAAEITGKKELQEELAGANYGLMGEGKMRVYILDECHKMSDAAQNLLLKYVEDATETTTYILPTTAPQRVIETLQSRCICYELKELDFNDITALVTRLLKKVQSKLPADRLVDVLVEAAVFSPRLICHAVEKYVAGSPPDEAAQVQASTTVNVEALTRGIVKGDWPEVSRFVELAQGQDLRPVRLGLLAYLRAVLIETPDICDRGKAVSKGIEMLASVPNAEDLAVNCAIIAQLYQVTSLFAKYQL